MDQLVESAGFRKLEQRIDQWGIFTVSLATRAAGAGPHDGDCESSHKTGATVLLSARKIKEAEARRERPHP